jgi:hypothetical protein
VRAVVVNRLETTMVLSMVEQEITMQIEPEEGFRRILAG